MRCIRLTTKLFRFTKTDHKTPVHSRAHRGALGIIRLREWQRFWEKNDFQKAEPFKILKGTDRNVEGCFFLLSMLLILISDVVVGLSKDLMISKPDYLHRVWKGILAIRDLAKIRCGIRENSKIS